MKLYLNTSIQNINWWAQRLVHMYQLVSIVSFENDELAVIAVVDLIQDRVKQGFILTAKAAPRYCISLSTERMLMWSGKKVFYSLNGTMNREDTSFKEIPWLAKSNLLKTSCPRRSKWTPVGEQSSWKLTGHNLAESQWWLKGGAGFLICTTWTCAASMGIFFFVHFG